MADFPFTDSDGHIFYCDPDKAKTGASAYVAVVKDGEILCALRDNALMFTLPEEKDVLLRAEPSGRFEITACVIRGSGPVKEKQNYTVYEVGGADLENIPLEWVKIRDILLGNVIFDATLKSGIKNLLVRKK